MRASLVERRLLLQPSATSLRLSREWSFTMRFPCRQRSWYHCRQLQILENPFCASSSVGRASASQAEGRGSESRLALLIVMGTLGGFPYPPALWLRRAKPGSAYAFVLMGTLGGFPSFQNSYLCGLCVLGGETTHHRAFGRGP